MAIEKKKILQVIIALFVAFYCARLFNITPFLPLMIAIPLLIVFVMLRYPFFYYLLSLFVLYRGFGFVHEKLIWLPGAFKLPDLLFVGLFIPPLIKLYKKEITISDLRSHFGVWILLFLSFCIFQMIRTYYEYYVVDFVSIIQISRHYFYYLFFFLALSYLDSEERVNKFLKVVLISVNVGVILIIIQSFLSRWSITVIPFLTVFQQDIAGVTVSRVRSPIIALTVFVFIYSFWHYSYDPRKRGYYLFSLIVCLLGVVFTFGRARLVSAFLGILLPVIFMQIRNKGVVLRYIMVIFISIIILAGSINLLFFDVNYLENMYQHFIKTFDDLANQTGTWGARLEDSRFRFELIKQSPIFGVGFLHDKLSPKVFGGLLYSQMEGSTSIGSADSGLVSILTVFGLAGVLIFLVFIYIFFNKISFLHRHLIMENNSRDYILLVSVYGWVLSSLFVFITLGLFTLPEEIILLSILCALIHKIELRVRYFHGRLSNNSHL